MNNDNHLYTESEIKHDIEKHLDKITEELKNGFELIKKHPKSVTIFGSSRIKPSDPYYQKAQELASLIVKETGYTVITGGGPGVMAAANLGAHEAQGNSLGFAIDLPREQKINPYVKDSVMFKYFLSRKALLTFSAETFIFFPGGYGTFDEFFTIITLIQNQKIPRVPIILFGKDFWGDLKNFITKQMLEKHGSVDKSDLDLFVITDNMSQVLEIIKRAPVAEWWKKID